MENCPVEEEIPPALHDDRIQAKAQPDIEPPPVAALVSEVPSLCRFLEEHLQLIFNMRRDAADQLHRHTILYCHMDALFDSLSSEPVTRRCPTCCQPYVFGPA
jgi:hypothetical protein